MPQEIKSTSTRGLIIASHRYLGGAGREESAPSGLPVEMDSGGACFCTGIKLEKLQKGTKGFISDIIPVSTAGQGPYRT